MSRKTNRNENTPVFMSVQDKLLSHENSLWGGEFSFIAGIDEAGRGCMAGPVVAAAVMFTDKTRIPAGLNDSKKLSHAQRMVLRERLMGEPSVRWAVGLVEADEIDRINILQATWKAMRLAAEQIKGLQYILVDGNPVKGLPVQSEAIVKGDALSASIAAASIMAKTHRDLLMTEAAEKYPQYGFEVHKGYCTKEHIEAVRKYGPCPLHRLTYAPIREILNPVIQGELF